MQEIHHVLNLIEETSFGVDTDKTDKPSSIILCTEEQLLNCQDASRDVFMGTYACAGARGRDH